VLRFMCPVCKHVLSTKEEFSGRTTKCPKCAQEIIVPDPQSSGCNEQGRGGIAKRVVYYCAMVIVSTACAALLVYTVFRLAELQEATALATEKIALNEDLLKRAAAAQEEADRKQEEADRKLALATEKEHAAEEAPRRAAALLKEAEVDRKQAKEGRTKAELVQEANRQTLEAIAKRQKQALEAEREANRAKMEADAQKAEGEKLIEAGKQALKQAAGKLQQAEEKERKASATLKRMETLPGLKALMLKMTSKVVADRRSAASLLKELGPGIYPDSVSRRVLEAATGSAEQNDVATAKALLDAFAVISPELAPAVVSLMLSLQLDKEAGKLDFSPWRNAVRQVNVLERGAVAPVLRFRLKTLLNYIAQEDVALIATELVTTLAKLAPDEESVKAIADALTRKVSNNKLQDEGLQALVAIYPKANGPVCAAFGRLAKGGGDTEFLIKLAKAAVTLRDKRLPRELAPLRFHASAEVREAAEAVFRLEM
jgi:hypothetical protein